MSSGDQQANDIPPYCHITSHHITWRRRKQVPREITTVIDLLICYY